MPREKREAEKRAVGRRARAERERQGLTVAEVAERAGMPRQYVYDLEGGVRVSVRNVCGAARALGVTVDYLLGLDEVPSRRGLTGPPVGLEGDLEETG